MDNVFSWFPKITRALERVPEELRGELSWALIRYGTYGEEPELEWPLDAMFETLRDDIDHSKDARKSGRKGGRPKASGEKPEKNASEKRGVSETEKGGFETEKGGFSETERGVSEDSKNAKPNTIQYNTKQYKTEQDVYTPLPPLDECDEEGAAFCAEALAIFNEETGADVRALTADTMISLRRIRDSGRTLDDVRAVLRSKSDEWGDDRDMARYIRPSTIFGEKFEEYLAAAKSTAGRRANDEYSLL